MTLYQKVMSVFGLLRTSIGLRVAREELAPLFSAAQTYHPGRLVVYDNVLYHCITKHTGAWDASHFVAGTVDAALPVSRRWPLVTIGNGEDIVLDACNTIDCAQAGGTPTIYLPQSEADGCRRFTLFVKNADPVKWNGHVIDRNTGESPRIHSWGDSISLDELMTDELSWTDSGTYDLLEISRNLFMVTSPY